MQQYLEFSIRGGSLSLLGCRSEDPMISLAFVDDADRKESLISQLLRVLIEVLTSLLLISAMEEEELFEDVNELLPFSLSSGVGLKKSKNAAALFL